MSKKTMEEVEAELLRCSNESQRSLSSSSKVLGANRPNFLVGSDRHASSTLLNCHGCVTLPRS